MPSFARLVSVASVLVCSAAMAETVEDSRAQGHSRLAVARRVVADARRAMDAFVARARARGMPMRTVERLEMPQYRLGVLERSVASGPVLSKEKAEKTKRWTRALTDQIEQIGMLLHVDCAAQANEQRGLATDFALGVESAMTKVLPVDAPFEGTFPNDVIISAARNEYEHVQIVVVPIDTGLRDVRFAVSELRGEGAVIDREHLSLHPVGFVKSREPHATQSPLSTSVEWWPDPIMSHRQSIEVAKGMVQPLWLTVYVPTGTPAGVYVGLVAVEGESMDHQETEPKGIKVILEVLGFDLPVQQHLRTIWGMTEANWSRFYMDRYGEAFAQKYVDLLLERRLSVADLYRTKPTAKAGEDSLYHLANPAALRKLRARGSAWWNLGYVLSPEHAAKSFGDEGKDYAAYLAKCVRMFRTELSRVNAAGWPHDSVGIFFLDETKDMESLALAAKTMKEHFPGIPLMTTGYHRGYGLTDDPVSKSMDIWIPLTPRYAEDLAKITEGRKRGKQAWWYIRCGPRDPRALNWFVQTPLIRARLLMGAAAQKLKPDGFLYYRVDGGRDKNQVLGDSSFVNWDPFYCRPDGDGTLIYPGPGGPLGTIRLDTIRDGLEDYEYYWLLERLVAKAEAKGLGESKLVRTAKAMLAVPDAVLKSLSEYTEDPESLAAHRYGVAQAILALGKAVE